MYLLLLMFFYLVIISRTEEYNITNAGKAFDFFKQKYNKEYQDPNEEEDHLANFVQNMNTVNYLNENDTLHFYTINRYGDEDPEYIREHYALGVVPYDSIVNQGAKNFLLGHIPREQKTKDIKAASLYDLDNANELWEEYLTKHNKTYNKTLDNTIHYYRFIKTLVDKNRHNFEEHSKNSEENQDLDGNADILREPDEFFV